MIDTYFTFGSVNELVFVKRDVLDRVQRGVAKTGPIAELFDPVAAEVWNQMEDSFSRFKSHHHCVQAVHSLVSAAQIASEDQKSLVNFL